MLGSRRLHFVPARPSAALPRLDLPLERVVTVGSEAEQLVVGVVGEAQGSVERYRFSWRDRPDWSGAGAKLSTIVDELGRRIRRDTLVDRIELAVLPWTPKVEFLARVDSTGQTGQGSIFDKAMAAGAIVATPCAVCMAGLCPPQALLGCGALFAAGAAVGGMLGIFEELPKGVSAATPAPDAAGDAQRAAVTPATAVAEGRLGQAALQQCVTRRWDGVAGQAWRDQGRTAALSPAAVPAAPAAGFLSGATLRAEVGLTAVTLGAEGTASANMQLAIHGVVRLVDAQGHAVGERTLRWESGTLALDRLTDEGPAALRVAFETACDALGLQAVAEAEAIWLRH